MSPKILCAISFVFTSSVLQPKQNIFLFCRMPESRVKLHLLLGLLSIIVVRTDLRSRCKQMCNDLKSIRASWSFSQGKPANPNKEIARYENKEICELLQHAFLGFTIFLRILLRIHHLPKWVKHNRPNNIMTLGTSIHTGMRHCLYHCVCPILQDGIAKRWQLPPPPPPPPQFFSLPHAYVS